ncbi:MAG: MFS transporter [Anaerolineae bacterium]|nr:MFS transporter [Anaerolineae bacterium]
MRTRFYYGWYITVTLAITETISWGIIYYAFTVFLTPMEHDLGWSRTELTGGYSLALLVIGAMAFPVGSWIDRHGARLLMTLGSIGAALLVLAWSQVRDVTMFYLIWIALGVCAAATLYDPAFAVVATWFNQRRSTALAIVTFAAGLASTIFIPLSDFLLNQVGWRNALVVLAILLGVVTIPLHALVLRRRPEDLGLLPDGGLIAAANTRPAARGLSLAATLHTRVFWLLTLAFGLLYLATHAVRVHFIPLLIDMGIDSSSAALASGSIGLLQVAGRVIFAPLDTRLPGRIVVAGVFTLQAVAISVLLVGHSAVWTVGLFIILFGTAFGATTLARPSLLADLFGTTHYGRISSIMTIFLTLAGTAAPVGAGLLYDHFGSYEPVLLLALALAVAASAVMWLTRPESPLNAV